MSRLNRLYPKLSRVGQSNRVAQSKPLSDGDKVHLDEIYEQGWHGDYGLAEDVGEEAELYGEYNKDFVEMPVSDDISLGVVGSIIEGDTIYALVNINRPPYIMALVSMVGIDNEQGEPLDVVGMVYAEELDGGQIRLQADEPEYLGPIDVYDAPPLSGDNLVLANHMIEVMRDGTSATIANPRLASRTADVNIVDDMDDVEGLELTDVTTYPGGEQPSKQTLQSPTKQRLNPADVTRGVISMRQIVAEFGFNLDELAEPSVGGVGTDSPADNHQSENDSEDPDLKLGGVEEPYSSSGGPLNVRFDEDHEYDIVKGAQSITKLSPEEYAQQQVRADEVLEQGWHGDGDMVDVSDDARRNDRINDNMKLDRQVPWTVAAERFDYNGETYLIRHDRAGIDNISLVEGDQARHVGIGFVSSGTHVDTPYLVHSVTGARPYPIRYESPSNPIESANDFHVSIHDWSQVIEAIMVDNGTGVRVRNPRDLAFKEDETGVHIASAGDPDGYLASIGIDREVVEQIVQGTAQKLLSGTQQYVNEKVITHNRAADQFNYVVRVTDDGMGEDGSSVTITTILNGTARIEQDVSVDASSGAIDPGDPNVYDAVWTDLLDAVADNLYMLEDKEDIGEKEAVGLIEGPVSDENTYSDPYGRADSAIPRSQT